MPSTKTANRVHPRAWFRVALILLGFLVIILPHFIVRIFQRYSPFAIWFLQWAGWCAGGRVRVVGTPVTKSALLISNHVSWMDILVLAGVSKSAFVAKADMETWPVLGWLADQNNTMYVRREDLLDAKNQAEALQRGLRSGQPITLFPEGTTVGGRELLPFRSSLIAAVTPPPEGVQIVPVAIDYGELANEIAWLDTTSVGQNALAVMSRKGSIPVTIHFLPPIDVALVGDRKAIARHCRAEIAAALGVA